MNRELRFKVDGVEVSGYFAQPEGLSKGPAVIVIHEWWGLVPHIKDVCDRYAREGFFAFGIDLYKGKTADNPDDAGRLMQDLFQNRFDETRSMVKATIDYFKENDIGYIGRVQDYRIGMTGFCCGGTCTWFFGAEFNQDLHALAPYYGLYKIVPIDYSKIKAPVMAVHAGKDSFVTLSDVMEAIQACNTNDINAQFLVYAGVEHAFFNDTRPEVYHEDYAVDVWEKTVNFFKKHLG